MRRIETIAVVGAGALGVMYAHRLTERLGKEKVWVAADAGRIERYEAEGFTCNGTACDFHFVSADKAEHPADLVVFAVKYTGLLEAIQTAGPLIGADTVILSLLNGISSEEMLARAYGEEHVLYCVAQGMDAVREGRDVTYRNLGLLVVGERDNRRTEKLRAVMRLLEEADIPFEVPGDIMYCQWSKLMLNTGVNQVTAVFGIPYRGVQEEGAPRQMMREAMGEVKEVANACGVPLSEADIEGWVKLVDSLNPDGMPSMRQDTKAGRRTEVELFSGAIRRLGREHGIPTPVNNYLYNRISEIESVGSTPPRL